MIKIIYRSFIGLIIILLLVATYLSIFGIKTDKLNSKIISQIHEIEPNIKLKLNDVSAKLDIFTFGINAKTIGTNLIYRNKEIKIETINSKINISSFLFKKLFFNKLSITFA